MEEKSDILIDYPQVVVGMYLTRKNAKRLFDDAKFLFDNAKYQSAIPIFVLSIEESFKSLELSIKFRKRENITQIEWNNLQLHKHKLNHIADFVIGIHESLDEKTEKEIAKELGQEDVVEQSYEILQYNRAEKGITSQFQFLKERCIYQNWNKEFCEWDDFEYLSKEQKEDLAYYIMIRTENQLHQLDFSIEWSVHVIRRDYFMIKNLEFPNYNELREPKDFETKFERQYKTDHFKYHRGLKVLELLIVKKTFGVIDQIQTHTIIDKCIKFASKNNLDNWFPHPMIKAVYNALVAMQEDNKKEGKYAGVSGDADQTKEGEPMMLTMCGISKKEESIIIDMIMINGEIYSINDKVIEQILKTELIIDSKPGKEIPLEKMHQAFAEIGLKMRKLKDSEIEPAITQANSMIDQEKFVGLSKEMKQKIKQVTKQNWDDQDPLIRSMIGSAFNALVIKDENTLVMTGHYDPIQKFKVRGMLYQMLVMRNKMNMKTDKNL